MRIILSILLILFSLSMNGDEIDAKNMAFRNVKVNGSNGIYLILGEAKPDNGIFYFTVEDGHVEYISEKQIRLTGKYMEWEKFKLNIQIPKEKLPDNGSLILYLYERTGNGPASNTFPVLLEKFY